MIKQTKNLLTKRRTLTLLQLQRLKSQNESLETTPCKKILLKAQKQEDIQTLKCNEHINIKVDDSKYQEKSRSQTAPLIIDVGNLNISERQIKNLRLDVRKYRASSSYCSEIQEDIIEPHMRKSLIGWMVELHSTFEIKEEALYLAVNILDRYLSKIQISLDQLQLIGYTSLLLAAKYGNELNLGDLMEIKNDFITKEQVITCEKQILMDLNFKIQVPTAYQFFKIFAYQHKFKSKQFLFAKLLLEISQYEYSMLKIDPYYQAQAAVWLSSKMIKCDQPLPGSQKIIEIAMKMHKYLQQSSTDYSQTMEKFETNQNDNSSGSSTKSE